MTASSLPWIILSPIAVVTDVFSVVILSHYRLSLHGSDVIIISIVVCLMMNVLVLAPVPALLEITKSNWNSHLCDFYVWTFLTLRTVQPLNLSLIAFHWSSILKFSTRNVKTSTTYVVKFVVPILWFVACVIGLLPIIGAVSEDYKLQNTCRFLATDLNLGFGIFMVVFVLTFTFICLLCSFDSLTLIHYAKKIAFIKYGAGRFYLPRKNNGVAGNYTVHERYGQLNFASDLCRLVTIMSCLSLSVSHLPYTVIEFLYLSIGIDRQLAEDVVIWLSLAESLIIPHVLWAGSRRYRHALSFFWRVHILRQKDSEENPDSCTLQSFTRKIKDVPGMKKVIQSPNNLSPVEQVSRTSTLREARSSTPVELNIRGYAQQNHISNLSVEVHSSSLNSSLDGRSGKEFRRSGSSGSRRNDQLKRQHLPSIFVNETFDGSDEKQFISFQPHSVARVQPTRYHEEKSQDTETTSQHSMYFYMSSDYHPDNLNTDSLPRRSTQSLHKSNSSSAADGGLNIDKYRFSSNSLPRTAKGSLATLSNSGSMSSITRKKYPKMGLSSTHSGSSSSLHQSHSRSSSGNVYITGHSRSASGTIFKSTNIPATSVYRIQKRYSVPRQESDRSESEGVSGQYGEFDIANVLDTSLTSEDLQVRPIEIPSVTVDERRPDFKLSEHQTKQFKGKVCEFVVKDKEQLSDENDSGCMANCAEETLDNSDNSGKNYDITCKETDSQFQFYYNEDNVRRGMISQTTNFTTFLPDPHLDVGQHKETSKLDLQNSWVKQEISQDLVDDTCSRQSVSTTDSVEQIILNAENSSTRSFLVSPRFDENTDRGFEEALNASYNSRESLCSCGGAYVESVSEFTELDVFDSHECPDDQFKTQAVVSRHGFETYSENNFSKDATNLSNLVSETGMSEIAFQEDFDSVFSIKDSSKSPWPESDAAHTAMDMSFDSDFSKERQVPDGSRNTSEHVTRDIEAVYF